MSTLAEELEALRQPVTDNVLGDMEPPKAHRRITEQLAVDGATRRDRKG